MQSLQNMWKHRVMITPFGRSLHTEQRNICLYASISSLYSSALPPCLANFSFLRFSPAHVSSHFWSFRSHSVTFAASSFDVESNASTFCSAACNRNFRCSEASCASVRVLVCVAICSDASAAASFAFLISKFASSKPRSIAFARASAACAAPRSCFTAASMPCKSSRKRRTLSCAWFFSVTAFVTPASRSASRSMSRSFSLAASSYAAPIASISAMNASASVCFSASAVCAAHAAAAASEASRVALAKRSSKSTTVFASPVFPRETASSAATACLARASFASASVTALRNSAFAASSSVFTNRASVTLTLSCAFSCLSFAIAITLSSSSLRLDAVVCAFWPASDTLSRSSSADRARVSASYTRASASCALRCASCVLSAIAVDARKSCRNKSDARCNSPIATRNLSVSSRAAYIRRSSCLYAREVRCLFSSISSCFSPRTSPLSDAHVTLVLSKFSDVAFKRPSSSCTKPCNFASSSEDAPSVAEPAPFGPGVPTAPPPEVFAPKGVSVSALPPTAAADTATAAAALAPSAVAIGGRPSICPASLLAIRSARLNNSTSATVSSSFLPSSSFRFRCFVVCSRSFSISPTSAVAFASSKATLARQASKSFAICDSED
mmetsp:Transcript_10049/g.37265  ORF Transcript_10049/g.37265 Transcript_10049/m.37265 type:complete len:615 (-) Transcript_10049:605-2449(-)